MSQQYQIKPLSVSERVRGRTQGSRGTSHHRLTVPEAGDVDLELGKPFQRPPRSCSIGVEGAQNHLPLVLGDGVPGNQNPQLGQVHGDAARGVTRHVQKHQAAGIVELQPTLRTLTDTTLRGGPQASGDDGMQNSF